MAKTLTIQEIDADTWAASGGTAGIFGKLFKKGKLKIVDLPEASPSSPTCDWNQNEFYQDRLFSTIQSVGTARVYRNPSGRVRPEKPSMDLF